MLGGGFNPFETKKRQFGEFLPIWKHNQNANHLNKPKR